MTALFQREDSNPLLTPRNVPFPVNCIFNPGVTEGNGEVILLARVERSTGVSELLVARSADGITSWKLADRPLLGPGDPAFPFERWGCEDARVTDIPEIGRFMISYTAYSEHGPALALASTSDFSTVERLGVVMPPNNKDAVLFPRRIQGRWRMLHRPVSGNQGHIWYSCSDDFLHWGMPGVLLAERGGPWWDGVKVGAGAVPIETEEGWLLVYHGVKEVAGALVYQLGLALLDLERPEIVLARTNGPIFGPEEPYEQLGVAPNVVFTCGCLERGDEIWMYYGAADTRICLARAKLADLIGAVRGG